MSDMNYEKAWGELKGYLTWIMLYSKHLAESEKQDADDRLRAQGTDVMARAALGRMDSLEKEMTTANEGRSEK